LDAFKAAVFVFWLSWFANQRGCPPKFRSALFAQLISTTAGRSLEWFNENLKTYETVWNKVHDVFLKHFVSNVMEICDGWLRSPAGDCYKEKIKMARYILKELDRN